MVAPSQPTVNSQPYQNRSPMLLDSLLVGGLVSSAILAGFFLIRSPLSEQISAPSPASSPDQAAIPSQSPSTASPPVTENATVSPQPIPISPPPDISPGVEPSSQPIAAQPLILKGTAADSQIDIYAQPSTKSYSPSYGLNGDRVTASRQAQDEQGSVWYFVQFASGAEGWIQSNFVQLAHSIPQPTLPAPDENTAFPQSATLTGNTLGSRVNVRSAPSTQADIPHYGLVGDRVTVLSQTQSAEGVLWYQVRFESGADGWVRSDFVQIAAEN